MGERPQNSAAVNAEWLNEVLHRNGALATMVANLASHKRGWDERWREFSDQADAGLQGKASGLQGQTRPDQAGPGPGSRGLEGED